MLDAGQTREEPYQEPRTLQGGTRVRGDEAEVRIRQGALSRTGQEREPIVCDVRSGEPVPVAQAAADDNRSVVVRIEAASLSSGRVRRYSLAGETNHGPLKTFYPELARTRCLFRGSLGGFGLHFWTVKMVRHVEGRGWIVALMSPVGAEIYWAIKEWRLGGFANP